MTRPASSSLDDEPYSIERHTDGSIEIRPTRLRVRDAPLVLKALLMFAVSVLLLFVFFAASGPLSDFDSDDIKIGLVAVGILAIAGILYWQYHQAPRWFVDVHRRIMVRTRGGLPVQLRFGDVQEVCWEPRADSGLLDKIVGPIGRFRVYLKRGDEQLDLARFETHKAAEAVCAELRTLLAR